MKNVSILIVALIFLSSCKKQKATDEEPVSSDLIQQADSGIPQNWDSIYGIFVLNQLPSGGSNPSTYQALAGFNKNSETLKNLEISDDGVKGSEEGLNVKVNYKTLTYYNFGTSSGKFYRAEDGIGDASSGIICELEANQNFPAVRQKVGRPFPELTNLSFVPESFSKSQSFVLSLNNKITGADSIFMQLYGPMDIMLNKRLPGSASLVTFSAAELSAAKLGKDNAILIVIAKNYSYKIIQNKTFVFIKQTGQSRWNIDVNP